MKLCDYGCGQEAKHPFKNGKWCCEDHWTKCPTQRKKNSIQMEEIWKDPESIYNSYSHNKKLSDSMKKAHKDPNNGLNLISRIKKQSNTMKEIWKDPNNKYNSISCKEKQSKRMEEAWKDPNSKYNTPISYLSKKNRSNNMKKLHKDPNSVFNSISYKNKLKLDIKKINIRHTIFSKEEEIRYNPNNPNEKEIQVHCKNHNCKNSKEKGGWFTPTGTQLAERIRQLENKDGNGGSHFYCSQHCKDTCILYRLQGDPYKNSNLPYTAAEKEVWRQVVLEREKGLCEYCGEPAEHVHHIFPVKIEPFFALDPDYGVACCAKHHYKYAHKDECSTGNLAKIVCSVESQKFLNQ